MKDKDRAEAKAAVAKMSKKERMRYYIGYYKLHALVVVIVAIIAISMIHNLLSKEESVLGIGIINGTIAQENVLTEDLNRYLQTEKRQTITVYSDLSTTASYDNGYYNMIDLYTASGDLNLAITDKAGVEYLAKLGACTSLKEVISKNQQNLWEERICSFEVLVDGSGFDENSVYEKLPVAINIAGTKLAESYGMSENCKYLVVVTTRKRDAQIQGFLDYLDTNDLINE